MAYISRNLFLLIALLTLAIPAVAQDDTEETEPPALTEIFDGSGRMADITFGYPEEWFTLDGIPITRRISFNVVSSVRVGLRNQLEPGKEAIVMAFSGGRVDRWPSIEPDFTPEEILTAFIEGFGDGGDFAPGGEEPGEGEEFEAVVTPFTLNDEFDAVQVRYETIEDEATEAEVDPDAEPELEGTFIAYVVRLDDNRFLVVLAFTSELTYEEAIPTVDAVLASLTYTPD